MRLSSVRTCPRKAVYEVTDAPAREMYDKEKRILWSGRRIGTDYLDMLEAGNGVTIERELKIPWPLGVGHADGWMPEARTLLEVLSSAHASNDMVASKLLQLVSYMRYWPAAHVGALLIVDPRDYSEERVIVRRGTPQWDTLAEQAADRVDQVLRWKERGILPDRVCAKPADARSHFCRHAEHCFEGWEQPVPDPIGGEETQQLVIRLDHVKAKKRELDATKKVLETEQKEIQAALEAEVPPGEWMIGGYKVKRSPRVRSSFKLPLAEKDSRFPGELLAEFTTTSRYDVWTTERTQAAADLDFGSEAPWTDEDLDAA